MPTREFESEDCGFVLVIIRDWYNLYVGLYIWCGLIHVLIPLILLGIGFLVITVFV